MNIADDAPSVGGMAVGVLSALYYALTTWQKWHKARAVAREQAKIGASPQLQPPQTDPHVLRRMDVAEYESALSVALVRERQAVDDLRRELAETRAERDQLVVELRARNALIERLRADLAKARARGRTAAVEVSVAEYRDASQAGPIQDALPTVRPPRR